MPELPSVAALEESIKQATRAFFSEGHLSDKIVEAYILSQMQGLDLFSIIIPWRLTSPLSQPISGVSGTLQFAASDIHEQLIGLTKHNPQDISVKIEIDEERLPDKASLF